MLPDHSLLPNIEGQVSLLRHNVVGIHLGKRVRAASQRYSAFRDVPDPERSFLGETNLRRMPSVASDWVERSVNTRSPSLRRAVPRSYSTPCGERRGQRLHEQKPLTPRAAYPGPPTWNVPVVGSATALASCNEAALISPTAANGSVRQPIDVRGAGDHTATQLAAYRTNWLCIPRSLSGLPLLSGTTDNACFSWSRSSELCSSRLEA